MQLLALLVVASQTGVRPLPVPQSADAQPILIKDVRVVVRPGQVIERGNIVLRGGKIASVGKDASVDGAKVIDGAGMTAYAAFINPNFAASVDGVSPERGATDAAARQEAAEKDPFGIEENRRIKFTVKDAKEAEVSNLKAMAEKGYGLVNLVPTGGLVSAEPAVFETGQEKISGESALDTNLVSFRIGGRSFTGYPRSTMGVIAFIRQALADASGFEGGGDDAIELTRLKRTVLGSSKSLFDDLNDNTFFYAYNISKEFGLRPVYEFRSGAGAVVDLLKEQKADVLLTGQVPSAPTIGDDLSDVRIGQVRNYVNEIQTGAQLEKAGVKFSYAPSSTMTPLEGLREYVQGGLSRDAALASITTEPARLLGVDNVAGTLEAGKRGDVVLVQGDLFSKSSQVMATFVGGKQMDFKMPEKKDSGALKEDPKLDLPDVNYDVFPLPAESKAAFRLYKNATVWTMGPQGVLNGADVLIRDGKIVEVGKGLKAPSGCETIDATGKHISPGIWDAHSHTAITGGVNEGSLMITVQCRIADVMDHLDSGIYVQLSGGTVGANQLHGSANAIGGQNAVVKWRWGQRPNEFRVKDAPEGVKFALGQNPIREENTTNMDETNVQTFRPRTRMGVEESIRKALQMGQEYNEAWADYNAGRTKVKPRRDLQLEGLGEIVNGSRWVHSHGYRADELLMLIRVTKEYGAKLATLQHVLEGYKIADEMAAAGVGGSTFSDWWGFKLEAYDAIPFNASLMADRGVSVSVNSDSGDHARRLNQEAAKSMRYGGATAEQALSFVTIEPARQLGIDHRTGSLEAGKDADIAIWTAAPTSMAAVCLETYVDGVKLFDRKNDAAQRQARVKELEAMRGSLEALKPANPFDDGGDAAASASTVEDEEVGPTTATFGIGPLTTQPGTMRYPRTAVLIQGATVHPMDGEPMVADVLIGADGKIAQVGSGLSANGATVVNGAGKHLYPGLIDPSTGLGLDEIGQVPVSDDSSERGNFHPDYRAERTINPEWSTLGVARHDGVLTALVKPSGAGIPGQAALIHTEGYTWEDLTVKSGAALMYSLGFGGRRFSEAFEDTRCLCEDTDAGIDHGHDHDNDHDHDHDAEEMAGKSPVLQQADRLESLTERIEEAREYAKKKSEATADKPVVRDQRLEAMLEVAEGRLPVMVFANSANDIKSVVAWAEENKVQVVLYGCSGAGDIAEWLAAKQVPIILAAVYGMPNADTPVDYYYSLPAKLTAAGVKFCLSTNENHDVRQLRDQAGWASAYGVDREEAARLITLRAAEVMGIDNRLGAIKAGLDGTVILCDGEIIETSTRVERAWIQGREVSLENRQTKLYDKYRTRPKG